MRRRSLTADELYEAAVRALARRDRTENEMRTWLRARATTPADIAPVLARLREVGYLDDRRVAAGIVAWQRDSERHGARRAERELRRRGVVAPLAAAALAGGFARYDEMAQLRAYIRKKRLRAPASLRETAALVRRWIGAGFSPAVCQKALRAWRLQPEWIEAVESIEPPDEPPDPDDLTVGID